MAVRRSSTYYLIVWLLILNFSKCLLSQEIEISTIASTDSVAIENNVVKDVPAVVIDEGGDAPTPEILEEKVVVVVNDLMENETAVEKDEEKNDPEDQADTSTLKATIQTETSEAIDTVLSTGTDKAAIATDGVEVITEKSETLNESTQSSAGPELTTLELQISVTDGQCVCGCNSGDNNNKEECVDSATASSKDDVVIDKRPEQDQTAQASVQVPCTEIGIFPNSIDCKAYYSCSNASGILQRIETRCPNKTAFSPTLKRCSRDITPCVDDDIVCLVVGNLPDPRSNTSYYWCADNFAGGFYKYRIECDNSEIFVPEIGKCFIDFQNIGDFGLGFGGPWMFGPSDRDIVKAEWKLLKAQEKAKAKQLKKQLKYEKKLQEAIEKKAMKDRKARAKEEAKSFVCTEEGNFPSASGQDRYFSCVNKKGKLDAMVMFCGIGYSFDAKSKTCVLPLSVARSVGVEDDDNDGDDDDDDDDDDD